jgi:hypothetical protein
VGVERCRLPSAIFMSYIRGGSYPAATSGFTSSCQRRIQRYSSIESRSGRRVGHQVTPVSAAASAITHDYIRIGQLPSSYQQPWRAAATQQHSSIDSNYRKRVGIR